MEINLYQVDAFTGKVFSGNPAALCPLDEWLSDEIMQKIAAENNLSETAFFVKEGKGEYSLRWFTPKAEVSLCGHATLATAYLIFDVLKEPIEKIVFNTLSGNLTVVKEEGLFSMDFPSNKPKMIKKDKKLLNSVSFEPKEIYFNKKKLLFLLKSEKEVINAIPNLEMIKSLDADGLIITARGESVDFVSRFFAPKFGVSEDPVTGSAHTLLIPFWAERLGKKVMKARQISSRGGDLFCEYLNDRVKISGNAVLYSSGKIYLSNE